MRETAYLSDRYELHEVSRRVIVELTWNGRMEVARSELDAEAERRAHHMRQACSKVEPHIPAAELLKPGHRVDGILLVFNDVRACPSKCIVDAFIDSPRRFDHLAFDKELLGPVDRSQGGRTKYGFAI